MDKTKTNTVTPISPVVIIPAAPDLAELVRLGADKIQKASPRIPRDLAEQLARYDLQDRLTRPRLTGLRVGTLRREMKQK